MNQNSVKTIGINDDLRKDAYLFNVYQVDGLQDILKRDFEVLRNTNHTSRLDKAINDLI